MAQLPQPRDRGPAGREVEAEAVAEAEEAVAVEEPVEAEAVAGRERQPKKRLHPRRNLKPPLEAEVEEAAPVWQKAHRWKPWKRQAVEGEEEEAGTFDQLFTLRPEILTFEPAEEEEHEEEDDKKKKKKKKKFVEMEYDPEPTPWLSRRSASVALANGTRPAGKPDLS